MIQATFQSGVARLTLNRPEKRNALTRGMIESISEALTRWEAEPELRVLVLESRGPVFCAGMDLGEMQQRAREADAEQAWLRDSEVYAEVLKRIFRLPVPTLAVVQGPALAGGMGLLLACDLVIANDESSYSLPEPMRGITAAMVTPLLLLRVGTGLASWMLLSGQRVSASEALAAGLCHRVVATAKLAAECQAAIESIMSGAPAALRITKQHLHHCAATHAEDQIDYSIEVSAQARETEDAREGLAAFLEKRKPNWQKNI